MGLEEVGRGTVTQGNYVCPHLLCSRYMSGPSKIASVPDEDELERARLQAQARKAAATAAVRSLASVASRNNPVALPPSPPAADGGTTDVPPTGLDGSGRAAAAVPAGLAAATAAAVAQVTVHIEQETIPFEQIVLVWRDLRCGPWELLTGGGMIPRTIL